MPFPLIYQAHLALLLIITGVTFATPRLSFPINSQVPPVAYVSETYEFTFSSATFSTDSADLSYKIVGGPSWLAIDSVNRKLSGTPAPEDTGAPSFELIASDEAGETSCSVTLVVLKENPVSIGKNVLTQLIGFGPASAPATLFLHPEEPFSFHFSRDTFRGISNETSFYAVSSDGSPLPAWLQFSPEDLGFSGTTPSSLVPTLMSQPYGISLSASNVVGFSQSNVQYQIMIGTYLLAFNPPEQNISIAHGASVHVASLLVQLFLDGKQVHREDLQSVATNAPSWLTLNETDLSLSGTAPNDVQSLAFSVSVTSNDYNHANTTVLLQAVGTQTLSQTDLGTFNATIGTRFSRSIQNIGSSGYYSSVTAQLESASWLVFDTASLTLYGYVPDNPILRSYTGTITFNNTYAVTVGTFTVNAVPPPTQTSPSGRAASTTNATQNTSAPTTTAISTPSDNQQSRPSKRDILKVVLAVVLPIVFLVILVGLVLYCSRIRRKERNRPTEKDEIEVFAPPLDNGTAETPNPVSPSPTKWKGYRLSQCSSGRPPRVDLPWAPDSFKNTRRRFSKRPNTAHSSMIGPSWDDLIMLPTPSLAVGEVPVIDTRAPSLKSGKPVFEPLDSAIVNDTSSESSAPHFYLNPVTQSETYRISKTPTFAAQTIGIQKRMSGAGHGAGIRYSAYNPGDRLSWQTTFGTMSLIRSRPSTILLESFPKPPTHREMTGVGHNGGDLSVLTKPTLRLVHAESGSSDGFETARHDFYTEQVRHQFEGGARFGNAGGARTASKARLFSEVSQSALRPLSESGNTASKRHYPQSWSRWSAVGPAGMNRMSTRPRIHVRQDNVSMASSRQFDSAVSSDSQWEDEDLVADESSTGDRHWQQPNHVNPNAKASPRLPFEPHESRLDKENIAGDSRDTSGANKARSVDQRKHVSVEDTEMQRSQRSHRGSFRFI